MPVLINKAGASNDLRVESNTQTHALLVQGASDRVYVLSQSAGKIAIDARTDKV